MNDVSRKKPDFVKQKVVNTRQAEKIILSTDVIHSSVYAHSPYAIGASLWNKLDADIQKTELKINVSTRQDLGKYMSMHLTQILK